MRTVIYARVSKDRTGQQRSVTDQVAELTAEVGRRGWQLVGTITDNDASASRYARGSRPGWDTLLDLVAAGDVDAVAFWELSRTSRQLAVWARFRDLCADHGVVWLVRDRMVNPDDGDERLSVGVKALMAEDEAERTRQRVLRTTRAAAAAGRPHGRNVYGYTRVYDTRTGQLVQVVEDPDQARVVRDVASRLLRGESLRAVTSHLNDAGTPTPTGQGSWHTVAVKRLATRPTYAGLRTHRPVARVDGRRQPGPEQTVTDAVWPAILTRDEHEQLVALLTAESRGRHHGRQVRHWLSGVLVCSECHGPMRVLNRVNGGPGYTCTTRGCHKVTVAAAKVEQHLRDVVVGRLRRPDAAAALTPRSRATDAQRAAVEVVTLTDRLDAARGAYAAGELPLAALTSIEATLAPPLAAARRRAANGSITRPLPAGLLADPDVVWDTLDAPTRRGVARVLLDKVMVHPAPVRGWRGPVSDRLDLVWHRP
jgi:DNA invertase Pin-like site-specific DNA recombinase